MRYRVLSSMQAPHAVVPKNQVACGPMSEAEARAPKGAGVTPPAAAPGGGGLAAILCAVTAAGAAVIALLARGSSDALLLTLLASLAILGVFFLLGTAAGHIRLSERTTFDELAAAAADELETAVLVTARDGAVLYANGAVARVLGGTAMGAPSAIEAALGGTPSAAEALYRLQRAAEAGEVRREEILPAAAGAATDTQPRCLSIEVRPYSLPKREGDLGPLALWQIRDTTRERAREAEALAHLHRTLDGYDEMPVGLAVGRSDGSLQHVNATFARAIGAVSPSSSRNLKLADVLPADAAQLLLDHARARPGDRAELDLDLKREDGSALPARVVWSGSATADDDAAALRLAILPRTSQRAAEPAAEAEVRFSRFYQSAPFGIATVGADGRVTTANAAFARMILDGTSGLGEHAADVLCRAADADVRATVEAGLAAALGGQTSAAPIEITVGAGASTERRTYVRRVFISPLVATHARDAAILYVVDATEQKALEEKYAQSQKMEAVGKLAGGIAHDFNNVLTAILGFSDLLLQTHRPGDPAHRDIMNIKNSANRAAGLVGQLLGFSRRQTQQNETLDLGEAISTEAPMLQSSVGETVKIKFEPPRDLWLVKADRSQITNVILNLAVNARDAMPGGGTLSIHARNVSERESQRLGNAGLPVGEYVVIEVADTGCGMTPEVMARMFEPFFTTKGVGKGTGLGLASVYGIVRQSGGYIFAESEPGKGTTFRIYLPRVEMEAREEPAAATKERKKPRPAADLTGTGRVLLVEDEDVVRSFAVRALKGRGYEVLEASTGAEALEVLEREQGRVDIVVSDVVMPEMDGPTLLKELRRRKPELKVIFVSGYPNEAFQASIDENEQFAFLPKPFSLPQLAAKVKEELRR